MDVAKVVVGKMHLRLLTYKKGCFLYNLLVYYIVDDDDDESIGYVRPLLHLKTVTSMLMI